MKRKNDIVLLSKAARVYNVSLDNIVNFLATKDINIIHHPNTKLDIETYSLLESEFGNNNHSEINNWVRVEYIPDDYYDEKDNPEIVEIWNIITNSAKKDLIIQNSRMILTRRIRSFRIISYGLL